MDEMDDLMARLEVLSDQGRGNIAVEIIEAARRLDRMHLDDVEVHPCDFGNDVVRRQRLYDDRRKLSDLLDSAGLTLPRDES